MFSKHQVGDSAVRKESKLHVLSTSHFTDRESKRACVDLALQIVNRIGNAKW
jgi:hypothetical protein